MRTLRDISVRTRLVCTNFLMVFIPVVLLTIMGILLFAGLRVTGTTRQSELALLWPEQGAAMSIPYAVTSLRETLDTSQPLHLDDLWEDLTLLESQQIQAAVVSDGRLVYVSPHSDVDAIIQAVHAQCGTAPAALAWQEHQFAFTYTSPNGQNIIWAAGTPAFAAAPGTNTSTVRDTLTAVILTILVVAIIGIIWLGLSLSRVLSRQILEPLTALRRAAAAIRAGNLDSPLVVPARDELGQACQDFDAMRQELGHARKRQEQYEQNRKELIAGISHDLATPLTLLKGYASGILDGITKTPEKQRQYVQKIYTTSCSMEELVDSLFLFSKLDLGRLPFTLTPLPLARYLEDVTDELQRLYRDQGLRLSFTPCSQTLTVTVDALQFRRVLGNIVTNALKYAGTATTDIDITIWPEAPSVHIQISDHGQGVPAASLPKLFDTFYRADMARTDVTKGSGLGLAIAKQIITAFGGAIAASATPGGGLTITITLPITEEPTHETNTHH